MWQNDTDRDWEQHGRDDPYWAVLTDEQFRRENLTPERLQRFFASGEAHIEWLFAKIRQHVAPQFSPKRALEFGCGVGRLLLPLAQRCGEVTGVDISATMLQLAETNCRDRGVHNIRFVQSDDALSALAGRYDFIHSYIVFQHLSVHRSEGIVRRLIELLDENGVAALHFMYRSTAPRWRQLLSWISKSVPLGQALSNAVQRRPLPAPMMQMNPVRLEQLMDLLHENGVQDLFCHLIHQPGSDGIILFFQKPGKGNRERE